MGKGAKSGLNIVHDTDSISIIDQIPNVDCKQKVRVKPRHLSEIVENKGI